MSSSIVLFSLASTYIIFQENKAIDYTFTTEQKFHSRIGMTIVALIVIQPFLGIITRYLIYSEKTVASIMITRKAHHFIGWSLMILGFINS